MNLINFQTITYCSLIFYIKYNENTAFTQFPGKHDIKNNRNNINILNDVLQYLQYIIYFEFLTY